MNRYLNDTQIRWRGENNKGNDNIDIEEAKYISTTRKNNLTKIKIKENRRLFCYDETIFRNKR